MLNEMKKVMIFMVALLSVMAACDKGGEGAQVTDVQLDRNSLTLDVGGSATLTAAITPADATDKTLTWHSSAPNIATVDDAGTVVAVAPGAAFVTATAHSGGKSDICAVTVTGEVGTFPFGTVSFRSADTYDVGTQRWSDNVTVSNCNTTGFDGGGEGVYKPDCRENYPYGSLFSWEAVKRYGQRLCPDGWRVPTETDFCTLDKTLNDRIDCSSRQPDPESMANYTGPKWNGLFAGRAALNIYDWQAEGGFYWSQSEQAASQGNSAYMLGLNKTWDMIHPREVLDKSWGFSLRCVKDISL